MNPVEAAVVSRMGVAPLWENGFKGQGVTVAVLDSGMLPAPLFSGNIVEDLDFTGEGKPRDKAFWHGTQVFECLHLIAGEASVANLRVVPEKSEFTRKPVLEALQHCIDVYPRYRVINISLSFVRDGCPDECPLCRKVDEAYAKGMLVIAAAGNKGPKPDTLTCPATSHWAIANLATWSKEEEEYWDNHPIKAFWMKNVTGLFGKMYGTSYSAGYSSGAAALLFSAFPQVDADTVRFAMLEVDHALKAETGHDTTLKMDRVYDYLLGLRRWSNMGVIFTKNGALYPFLKPF